MIRFKDIQIPKPCSVDYDALPGDEVKRFCDSCEKHVYDFRGKNETYLNEVYQRTGMVCGIYYEDQIQRPSLKLQRPYYYSFITKVLSFGFFIKTFLTSHEAEAVKPVPYQITQISYDSIGVKTIYKRKNNEVLINDINIFCYVNDTLFKLYNLSYNEMLYLPSSFHPDDKIRLTVSTTRRNIVKHQRRKHKPSLYSTRTKVYNFIFKDIDRVTLRINFNKKIILSRKNRTAITGMVCPNNFW